MPTFGWRPPPEGPDERNWPMARALTLLAAGVTPTALDLALAAMMKSSTSKTTKAWAKIATPLLNGLLPEPVPEPPPPIPTSRLWADAIVLDQGNVKSCTGNGWAGFSNADPLPHTFGEDEALAIYWAAKVLDGEPGVDSGSSVESAAKAARNRGRISAYVFAATTNEALTWVLTQGPVVVGTPWHSGMSKPDAYGFVEPIGPVIGGHCYLVVGYDTVTKMVTCLNSWGADWGQTGRFTMRSVDFAHLFTGWGEAASAVEVA